MDKEIIMLLTELRQISTDIADIKKMLLDLVEE